MPTDIHKRDRQEKRSSRNWYSWGLQLALIWLATSEWLLRASLRLYLAGRIDKSIFDLLRRTSRQLEHAGRWLALKSTR